MIIVTQAYWKEPGDIEAALMYASSLSCTTVATLYRSLMRSVPDRAFPPSYEEAGTQTRGKGGGGGGAVL